MYLKSLFIAFAFWFILGGCSSPETDYSGPLRVPPLEPAEGLASFQIKEGFRIEQLAAEPLVADPIAMAFDESGRLYIVEMRFYPIIDTTEKTLGRIRLLEDTTGDGFFDKSTIFADSLRWPTAVFCWKGGVFVGATPNILYLKDRTGDDIADIREAVFTGFGATPNPAFFVQQMVNSFTWGLDNRIYGVTSGAGGIVKRVGSEEEPVYLDGDDLSFDPRSLEIARENGGLQHGMSFDFWGRRYITRQANHVVQVMYEEAYENRNPAASLPPDFVAIVDDVREHTRSAKIYHISGFEPWKVLLNRWWKEGRLVRNEGDNMELQTPGGKREALPSDTRGRTGGAYIISSSGITIYKGDAFPRRYRGSSFIGDGAHNIVHHDSLYHHPNSVEMVAARPSDEQHREFLASTDNWFRPVQFANGPDGTLYVADMYREVFDLPSGIPMEIQRQIDMRSGNDRGRIYRIVPEDFEQPKIPNLRNYTIRELVNLLEHPNAWHYETAARLLYERQDPASIPMLDSLLEHTHSPLGRLHALYALAGQDALTRSHVLMGLADSSAGVRSRAVRLSERFFGAENGNADNMQLTHKLLECANDPSMAVRYQLAFTLGALEDPGRIDALARILLQDPHDRMIHAAILSSLAQGGGEMFKSVMEDHTLRDAVAGSNFLRDIAVMLGTQNDPEVVDAVISYLPGISGDSIVFALTTALGKGLDRAGSSLQRFDTPVLKRILQQAAAVARDGSQNESLRVPAIHLTGLRGKEQVAQILFPLLGPSEPLAINLAVIESIGNYEGDELARELLQKWSKLTPRVRQQAITFMLGRPERISVLLDAIENDAIGSTTLTSSNIRYLQEHSDSVIRRRAQKLLQWGNPDRQQVIDSYAKAVSLEGDSLRGAKIYMTKCAQCHVAGDQGHAVGPNLGSLGRGKAQLLVDIIDPSRNMDARNRLYKIVTKEGETLQGILANRSTNTIVLQRPFGDEIELLRSNITEIQDMEQSLMPNGLEAGMTDQDMADLLQFITSLSNSIPYD